jgi:hypothetical protein
MYTFTHALLADPLAPLLAQMQLKVDPAGAPSAGGRSYLCVWRLIGSSLFLEQVLRPDLSGGEVLFGQDSFATPPADAAFFTAPEAELRKIRAWLCGKRRRWNREPLWLPATWVPDPIELVLACKGAELGVERADLSKPDPLHVRLPGDTGESRQFPFPRPYRQRDGMDRERDRRSGPFCHPQACDAFPDRGPDLCVAATLSTKTSASSMAFAAPS